MKDERRDRMLERAIAGLPERKPDDGLWGAIEAQLETPEGKNQKFSWRKVMSAAAVLVLLVSVLLIVRQPGKGVSYHEEVVLNWSEQNSTLATEDFDEFLEIECQELRVVCEDEVFQQLVFQLEQVSVEVTDLNNIMEATGRDEMLVKAQGKLEQESARLKKEIVKFLKG
ncbi:hypothetical protein [Roseivirga pacifica]|uniref:hypothetical protein n=1 Tax=Roseivirga pacifica TaxID=1267423 RepID=UPI00227BACD4|nr:hypothetical protein [Roseivirga pacifica]